MKFQFEFIEHTTGFGGFMSMPTMTRSARESKPSPILSEGTEPEYANRLTTGAFAKRNSGKYIDRRSNGVVTRQKIMNEL